MNENIPEEKINLEGIMYNSDGTFKPITANDGNINGNIAHLRNTYMESERNYFERLLAIEEIREEFLLCLGYTNDLLYKRAVKIQQDIEYGNLETQEELEKMKLMTPEKRDEYHMRKLERAEGMMCLLLAAIRDKVKILELVKTYTNDDEKSHGRSR